MKVLVIGGTRYMGRIAVRQLLDEGDQVAVFTRGNTRPDWWSEIEHIPGDRTEAADLAQLKGRDFDAVIDTRAFRKEDVESACLLLEGHVGRYLLVSTGSVYADGKLDSANKCPYRETDVSWADLDYSYPDGEDAYGVGKRHCEKWLQEESRGVDYSIVRIPAVMGWDDPTGRMWWWVQRALDGDGVVIPAQHRGVFRTLYSGDAARCFVRAVKEPQAANQIYHVSMREIMSMERWTRLIWNAVGAEAVITHVPQEIIARRKVLEDYEPPLSRALPYIQDTSKAEREFGFETTPVEEWIQTTAEWYRDEYDGDDSKGYEHRAYELSLAVDWQRAHDDCVSRFV